MDEKRLKEAFEKIRLETDFLKSELFLMREELKQVKESFSTKEFQLTNLLISLNNELEELNGNLRTSQKDVLYINSNTSSANLPQSNTYSLKFEGIKPYLPVSSGNEGVPTNPQQTNTQSNTSLAEDFTNKIPQIGEPEKSRISIKELVNSMKEELRTKFKALTKQEFKVFSTLFSLEQELNKSLSYKEIALRTGLTESTIRDYIGRLIDKGIPIIKERINNKDILISISPDLRNLASLDSLSSIKRDSF